MHTLKASWVGRTFALAKSNESGGKKSRIRRSKEERKAMVESFIKKHQKLNNGNFPSLSLTHKEVGGSFYTIREIVREIIQENRVLGPASFFPDDQKLLEQDSSSSVSMGPVFPLSLPLNGSHFVPEQEHCKEEKPVLVPDNFSSEAGQQSVEHGQSVNGSHVDFKDKESDKTISSKSKVIEPFEDNGVLRPDKLNPEEQDSGQPLEEDLLGSDSRHQIPLSVSFSELHLASEHYRDAEEKPVLVCGSISTEPGKKGLEGGLTMNRSHVDVENKESDEAVCRKPKEAQTFEAEKTLLTEVGATMAEITDGRENVMETTSRVTDISTNIIVEKFPLRPVTTISECLERSSDLKNPSESLKVNGIEKVDLGSDNGSLKPVNLADEGVVEKIGSSPTDQISDSVEQEESKSIADSALVVADCSIKDNVRQDNFVSDDTEVEESKDGIAASQTIEQKQPTANAELRTVPDRVHSKAVNGTSHGNGEASALQEATVTEERTEAQHSSSTQKGNNSSLNRIKPESWKGPSNHAAGQETNPLVVIFKSFIAAFVKFWSE